MNRGKEKRSSPLDRILKHARASRKKITVLVVILIGLSTTAVLIYYHFQAESQVTVSEPVNVILISWDDVSRNRFYELLRAGALPNTEALSAEGSVVNITITDHDAGTLAGHAEMLTGYGPEITGIYGARDEIHPRFGVSTNATIPEGLTVFERVEAAFGRDNIITIMAVSKMDRFGVRAGEPYHNARRVLDVYGRYGVQRGQNAMADVTGPKTIRHLNNHGSEHFFAFFHFGDPDERGHEYGENSREYEQTIIACDFWLGKMVETLKEAQVYNSTAIIVTADNGFEGDEKHHYQNPYVFAASNRPLTGNGDQKDIAPTVLDLIGVDIDQLEPPFPGVSLVVHIPSEIPIFPWEAIAVGIVVCSASYLLIIYVRTRRTKNLRLLIT